MENLNEKKPKRPRIGEQRISSENIEENITQHHQENVANQSSESNPEGSTQSAGYRPRIQSYQARPQGYNRYNQQGGYNRFNGDSQGYRPRVQYNQPPVNQGENNPENGEEGTAQQSAGYRPRFQQGYGQNRQGYGQGRQQGYNQGRPQVYGQGRQQGGFNQNRQQGYGQNRQGAYNQNRGGYNQNRQQGFATGRSQGYGPGRPQGYNQNRPGGYNQNRRIQSRHNQFGMPRGGKSFMPRPKRVEYEIPIPDPNEQLRLNKFMANAGICSRREADELIQKGLVKVNGNVVTELGTKISHNDTVEYDGKVVTLEKKCYILLNKPKDCVTTSDDPNGRLTVMDIVKGACDERIYPVGRLDRNTTGVLLLTNDGDLASKLTHPKFVKKKIYHVWTDKDITEEDMQRIADGIELDDGPIHADAISYATETDRNQAGIEIHSGRNRVVRRIFESLGYHVTKLDRVYFAGLTKKNLPRGRWRYLTQEEVNFLKMGSFE